MPIGNNRWLLRFGLDLKRRPGLTSVNATRPMSRAANRYWRNRSRRTRTCRWRSPRSRTTCPALRILAGQSEQVDPAWRWARRSVDLAQKLFEVGCVSYLDLLDAQRNLALSEHRLVGALIGRRP